MEGAVFDVELQGWGGDAVVHTEVCGRLPTITASYGGYISLHVCVLRLP